MREDLKDLLLRLPNPRPGSSTIRFFSTPACRARLAVASSSLAIVPITSGIGGSLPHVSGRPRMWLRIRPAFPCAWIFGVYHVEGQAARIVDNLHPWCSARSAVSDL